MASGFDLSDDYQEYCTGGFHPDDVVISGMSGRFPECSNVEEFREALHTKKNILIEREERFSKGVYKNCNSNSGLIKDLDKLDAEYFRMNRVVANTADPGARIHLEVVYEAIADSGYDPVDLQKHVVGIYNACTEDDATAVKMANDEEATLYNSSRCMISNTASFALNFIGPSHCIDAACSSSGIALHYAYNDLKAGNVDFAIVSATQVNLDPVINYKYFTMGVHTTNMQSVPFDEISNGMMRAETVAALFLQRASTARRAYASVLATRYYSSGSVVEGISVPSTRMQIFVGRKALEDAGLEPEDIQYLEAHGTGTPVGDPVELNSTAEIYLRNRDRKEPFYIGTVKSSVGHTESASAICGVINSIFAFETGMISPNRRYKTPNPKSKELVNGQMIVPTELTPLVRRYIPFNSFGLGGTLVASVLKGNPITYGEKRPLELPRLVLFPATTEEAIKHLFDYVKENYDSLREEYYALLNKLSFTPPFYKPFRGYLMLKDPQNPVTQIQAVTPKRPIWFIMTGMGCQWPGMGLQLMSIDVFAQSMRKSAAVLKKVGIDLLELLRADKNYLQINRNILPAFVTIISIQIAMVDLMTHIGITPDGIIGHSTGEISSAYADGCCTAEETIMSAYYRGKAVEDLEGSLPAGGMAAVGLSWEKAWELCPEGIYPVCHNAADSVTISGLKEPLEKFVAELQEKNIFARVVDAYGYGFHCKYVHEAATSLRANLKKLIKNPKQRTDRWLSTSYPESESHKLECKMADGDYFAHNLMNPVLFYEMAKKIPSNAITIEFGPHFLLQSLLKRTIGPEASYIGLMKRNHEDNVQFLFDSLGKLYIAGADPKIERLYPKVKFPVPCGTPILSKLIKWNHSVSYHVPKYEASRGPHIMDIKADKRDAYLLDHFIDGRYLFPAMGYVYFAWEAIATKNQKPISECPVLIQNFKIHRATIISETTPTRLYCSIENGTGYFEITDEKALIASGNVFKDKNMVFLEDEPTYKCDNGSAVSGKDLYNELKMKGYEYGPAFQCIQEFNLSGTQALVRWDDRWITYLDAISLLMGLMYYTTEYVLPISLGSIKIDPSAFYKYLEDHQAVKRDNMREMRNNAEKESKKKQHKVCIPVTCNPETRTVRAPGLEFQKLSLNVARFRGKMENPTTELYEWIPYNSHYVPDEDLQEQLTYYLGSSNKFIDDIGRLLGKNLSQAKFPIEDVDESEIEDFISDLSENHNLLKILSNISNGLGDIPTKKQDWLTLYLDNIGMEVVNNVAANEDSLSIMLRLILENTFKKISVLEVNNCYPLILPILSDIMPKVSMTKFKQSYLLLKKDRDVDEELLKKHDIQSLSDTDISGFAAPDKRQDLVIGSFMNGTETELKATIDLLHSVLSPTGFILLFHKGQLLPSENFLFQLCGAQVQVQPQSILEELLKKHDLILVSKISDPFGGSVYLIRPAAPDVNDKVIPVSECSYEWVDKIKNVLYGGEGSQRLWLVSDSPTSGVVGMVNCLKQEPKGERVRCVLISENKTGVKIPAFSFDEPFYKEIFERNLVMNVWKDGAWGSFKHVNIKKHKVPREVEHAYVNCTKYGDLSSFEWIESPLKYLEVKDACEVQIYYSTLNFKDVMLAAGKITETVRNYKPDELDGIKDCLGFEFSGRDNCGRRVCGMVRRGMATSTLAHYHQLIQVPDNWTLEQAATVPVVYATCIYALLMRARLQKGESILIHSGTGGIGLAAIRIAISLNCKIFVTVGTDEKREYLTTNFPQIDPENIGCSRNLTFEKMVMTRTKGRGVDVVLNSLAEDKFLASIRCVAPRGRYVEIGKYDLAMDRPIGTSMFLDDVTFHGVFLDVLFGNEPEQILKMKEIMATMVKLIKKGVVQPLERTVFGKNEVEDAFRYMAKGIHIGKILLKIRDEERNKLAIPKPLKQLAVPMTYFHHNKVYVIIGGLGGLGIEINKWMISRGARHIVLMSRYGARTPYHHMCLARWKKEGVDVRVSTLNLGRKDEAERFIKEVSRIHPIGGFINSAVVLRDAFMDSQTPESFREVCESKAAATKNLDELSRRLCPQLDYFVCFSSVSCGRGNAGQTNYGFANSVMERICEQRRRDGLHGLAIQWGVIGQVGVVHRHMGDDAKISGVIAQSVKSCVTVFDALLQQDGPVASSYAISTEVKKTAKGDILNQIAKVLGVNEVSQVSTIRSFGDMGFDSMIGVEIKQMIESYCDLTLTMQEIQELKIGDVKAMVEKADSEKSSTVVSSMIASPHLNLPVILTHTEPLQVLQECGRGRALFILNIGDEDIEGLKVLAKTLECTVYALLWTKKTPCSDIKAVASYFHNVIRSVTSESFNLASNSISANVALEMAMQSEKTDKMVHSVTFLYGSEDIVNAMTKAETKSKETDVQTLCRFVEQFEHGSASKLEEELRTHTSLEQRINAVISYLASSSSQAVSRSQLSTAITDFIKKRSVTEIYVKNGKISMDIHLFEDPSKVLSKDVTTIIEAFEKVAFGKIHLYRVCSPEQLSSIEDAESVAEIMTSYM